jgi:hypothetical protein
MESVKIIKPQWFEIGVFNCFKLTPEVIEKFTIDSTSSEIVRRDEKHKLGEERIHGTCKFCKYNSKLQYKNTSNWVRHLLVSFCLSTILTIYNLHIF